MNHRAYPPRRGLALMLTAFLIFTFLTSPAWAFRQKLSATAGDPGDGNLSPREDAAAAHPGLPSDSADTAAKTADVSFGISTRVIFWAMPLAGSYPGSGLPPFWFTRDSLSMVQHILRWEGGSRHVR
ncbi:hypothetical protein COW53_08785 [bacterium CG17_big_fil_post_rev_8_21_14_2_50_64_8]|nr:MAG: hypothetical protein COW53_08785 [bacterium CG17_big_fil_post_rev_8_21_14_2_50_64_8]PJA76537.1 MAG: hypothetical protein CO151_02305 [bacterium CG_4_9_14_3_um_filter_65_15]